MNNERAEALAAAVRKYLDACVPRAVLPLHVALEEYERERPRVDTIRAETEDERRLRVIREFFEACGYVIRNRPVEPGHPVEDLVMTPEEGAEIRKVFAPKWVESRQALRCAAAEAADHDCYLVRSPRLNRTLVYESAGFEIVGEADSLSFEAALVAVTRALNRKWGKSCLTPTPTT